MKLTEFEVFTMWQVASSDNPKIIYSIEKIECMDFKKGQTDENSSSSKP